MKTQTIRFSALLLALVMLLSTGVLAAHLPDEPMVLGVATVEVSGQRLRSEPSNDADSLTAVGAQSTILVLEMAGAWYKACYDGQIGYIRAEYLTYRSAAAADLGTGYVKYDSVNVRSMPNTNGFVTAVLNSSTAVNVTGFSNGWYRIADATGQDVGFVRSDLLLLDTMPVSEAEQRMLDTGDLDFSQVGEIYITRAADDSLLLITDEEENQLIATGDYTDEAVDLINYAFTLIGTPYVWGGNGPDTFDCSGFVKYVFNHFGYSMQRVANDMLYKDGVWVERADLQPGDVIFFGNTYSSNETATHVGIYIGGDQFIHASSRKGVTVSQLSSEYYDTRFVGAKRLIGGTVDLDEDFFDAIIFD